MNRNGILIETETEAEYGVPASVAGSRAWGRIGSTRLRPPIRTASEYVGVCRRLSRACPQGLPLEGEDRVDGRLVALGFRRVPPTEWIWGERRDGREPRRLVDFVSFWTETQERPLRLGSEYNALVEDAYEIWVGRPGVRWAALQIPSATWGRMLRGGRRWTRHARVIGFALRRASMRQVDLPVSGLALRRLGELCPELQTVALRGATDRAWAEPHQAHDPDRTIRIRHLDWEAVARVSRQINTDSSGRVRAAVAYHEWQDRDGRMTSRRFVALANRFSETDAENWAGWLCPAYPQATVAQAARLCLGESPTQLSGGVLSRSEAHAWLSAGEQRTPLEWLTHSMPGVPPLRSVAVARWLLDVRRRGGWGGLTRTRLVHGPAGATGQFRFLDRIDEIQDVDLTRGIRTSVEAAFRSAATRNGEAWLSQWRNDHRLLAQPPGWRWYPCMRPLVTRAQLVREGEEMRHCVGGYADAVERGHSVIVAMSVAGHRSTVEFTPYGQVLQHHGPEDRYPHPLCERVLDRFIQRRIVS